MSKLTPYRPGEDDSIEERLQELLADILPWADIELFLEENDIEEFSLDMSRRDRQPLSITSVYIRE